MTTITDIFELSLDELCDIVIQAGEKRFRAKQVYEWLHNHVITSYNDMNNVPIKLRDTLSLKFPLDELAVEDVQKSVDGTTKFLFRCKDENFVESVLIPNDDGRLTACISSQVGCAMNCAFCATGNLGFTRNLTAQEICFQVANMQKQANERIDNIVVMGQGEPFLNYENTLTAIKRINHDEAFRIAARKITVSSCGIVKGIEKFSDENEQFGLAISLHSANEKTRKFLMAKSENLEALKKSLKNYQEKTNRRITFEFMLLDEINDTSEECESLKNFCKGLLCHVNLLKFNEVENCQFRSSQKERFKFFEEELTKAGIACSVRKSKGSDIDGACGQLASRKNS